MIDGLKYLALSFLAIFFSSTIALALQVEVSPRELFPGDPFLIKVSRVDTSQRIAASIAGKEIPFSSCGEDCVMGIGVVDPETKPGDYVVSTQFGPQQLSTTLSVKKAEYPEQHLKLPEKQVTLSLEDLARTKKEAEKLKDLWLRNTERLFQGGFIIPLPNPISTVYGARRIFNNKTISIHGGIDIKGSQGEEVRASNHGTIVLAENLFFGGNTVVIDHGLGIYTIYMHLDRVKALHGQIVSKGDVIGFVGSSGRSTGPHLHFGAKIMAVNANPLSLTKLKLE
jgi:murein DD-endopeptidase MepM/ murein hydrolase activator NlpD